MHAAPYPEITEDFGNWLAGFIAGEGCFQIAPQNVSVGFCSYCTKCIVKLREDDRPVLDEIHERTGLGSVTWKSEKAPPGRVWRPQAAWQVQSRADCLRLVAILDAHPLRAKKARVFAVWRLAVLVGAQRRNGGNWALEHNQLLWERMAELRVELAAANGYAIPKH
jgi:hypothetical protein